MIRIHLAGTGTFYQNSFLFSDHTLLLDVNRIVKPEKPLSEDKFIFQTDSSIALNRACLVIKAG